MKQIIKTAGLSKRYGKKRVLEKLDLQVGAGKIVGLIGPNGAGKTTLLQSLLGLCVADGDIDVLGFDPRRERAKMLEQVCFIADTATLPRWMTVKQAIAYAAGVHPNFNEQRAREFLAKTKVPLSSRIRSLSKGMVTQVHLALVMAINAKLLVLDEPTLGLDLLYRRTFYDALLNDYYDDEKTILITTHQVEEVEHLLTDVMFIVDGAIVLNSTLEDFEARFSKVTVPTELQPQAQALNPIGEIKALGAKQYLFEGVERTQLEAMGEVARASLAEVFVAKAVQGGQT
ncbi:ABC transporter ATP-binding protein [Gilvimarinus sp. DA14]|uniref:ABC transporter ATP-binding protein n=1 Tax=Gilvimarinus sp. DA14 TaxID=2956798 RepID=UPI0020B883AC|nr:ABC transporter ATP-binding protein [Gilvimarinus sp. DA14]UTF58856.1 ABC transporter ATP-binding protein [Gilvimarinus sp. DA14]